MVFLPVVWLSLMYVVVAFAGVTAPTFGTLERSAYTHDRIAKSFCICTSPARHVFEELTGQSGLAGGSAATLCTLLPPVPHSDFTPA